MIPANGGESNTTGRVSHTAPASSPDNTHHAPALTALVAALVAPRTPCRRVRPLVERGPGIPDTDGRPLTSPGSVAARLLERRPVVAELRPDLVVLDLDGCATRPVLSALDAVAVEHGARLAYRAASGSRASEHHAYAVPEVERGAFVAAVESMRSAHGLDGSVQESGRWLDLDIRDGLDVRLPWSAPIKPGGMVVQPLHPDTGVAVGPWECLDTLETALGAAGLPEQHPGRPRRSTRRTTATTAPDAGVLDTLDALEIEDRDASTGPAALRHARRGGPSHPDGLVDLEPGERAALECWPEFGQRSGAALRAGRVLWAHGYREWSEVAPLVEKYPAFVKWQTRPDAAAWWARESARWSAWRAPVSGADAAVVESWRAHGRYMPPALETALHGVLEIMGDGRGVVARAVSVRDLVVVGGAASTQSAWRRLSDLVDAGVLEVSRAWADGPGDEATLYTLTDPSKWGKLIHEYTGGGAAPERALSPLHPLWAEISPGPRRTLEHMTAAASWTATGLSTAAGLDRGTVRTHLRELERVGLVVATGRRWSAAPVLDLDGAGERVDAVGAHARRVSLVEVERAAWRAETVAEQDRAARDLETARAGVRADAERRRPVVVEGVERVERVESSAARAVVAGDPLRGWPVGVEVSMFGAAAVAGGGSSGGAPPGWFADGGRRVSWRGA